MNVGDIVVANMKAVWATGKEVGIIVWASWSLEQTIQDIKDEVTGTRDLWSCKVLWNDGTIHLEDSGDLEVMCDPR